ncbi:nitrogen regulatory protein PII 2 [Sporomusaceae bacterium BoRhaA]|uniref:P-II family nitrogen regulator n=1 Tax=Pelorhabdus rhamnosifermentans TaxID=2772457 RepID=UPI001C05F962|nr:P-II family nitrogen regulator [Pelorhabdus rhamnosifermentans]MBU2702098.1 nitrogen regulatory protein PII 2 [Pelorhabdus rhamnosifermentans]
MKEIIAIVRMNKVGATKQALIEAGATGFTAVKALGRGKMVEDTGVIAGRKADLMAMANEEDVKETELLIDGFLNGARLYPMRMFDIITHDYDVTKIVQTIMEVNRTTFNVGDGKIFVLPVADAIRVRTKEAGDAAL